MRHSGITMPDTDDHHDIQRVKEKESNSEKARDY